MTNSETRRGLMAMTGATLGAWLLPSTGRAGDTPRPAQSFPDGLAGDIWPVHDPCIIRAGDTYHLFCTSQANAGKGLIHWRTSLDLITWTFKGAVMPAFPDWVTKAVPGTKGAWAPDIACVNGRYLLYYAASTFGANLSVIGLMTTPTLDTSDAAFGWTDEGLVIASSVHDDYNAIDPNHVVDADGRHWLALGSFWTGLKLVELDPLTNKPKDARALVSLARRPAPDAVEGAFIIRKAGFYYLFASYDFCCRGVNSSYYTVVCRSKDVQGPYVDRDGRKMTNNGGFLVLHADLDPTKRFKGPGHCAILQDGNADYIVYHAYDSLNGGRPQLRIQTLAWTPDGWPVAV